MAKDAGRKEGSGDVASEFLTSPYQRIGTEIGALVTVKNKAYGDSFATTGKVLRLLYPDGIRPEQYDDALALVRIWDKMKRIATDKDALGESPYRDIAGYGILGAKISEEKKNADGRNGGLVGVVAEEGSDVLATSHAEEVADGDSAQNGGAAGRGSEAGFPFS